MYYTKKIDSWNRHQVAPTKIKFLYNNLICIVLTLVKNTAKHTLDIVTLDKVLLLR